MGGTAGASSQAITSTKVVGTRQIFAGGRWEQVAWVRYDP